MLYCIKPLNNTFHLPNTVNVAVFPLSCLTTLSTTGYFCSLGSSEPYPVSRPYGDLCPMGHFCPEGSGSPRPCPVGSFLPEPGASTSSHCHPCPPGKYCLNPGSSQPTGGGFYQVSHQSSTNWMSIEVKLCKYWNVSDLHQNTHHISVFPTPWIDAVIFFCWF